MNTFGLPKAVKGKTYAEAATYIENLFKGRNSKIDMDTKKILMQRLRESQDLQKQEMDTELAQSPEANAFNIGGLMRNSYAWGGPDTLDTPDFVDNTKSLTNLNPIYNPNNIDLLTSHLGNDNVLKALNTNYTKPAINTLKQSPPTEQQSWFQKNKGTLSNIGSMALMAAPLVGNLISARNLRKPESVNPMMLNETVVPETINRQQIERNIANQTSTNRQALQENASGDFGQYAANLQALNSGSANALGNATLQANMADIQERKSAQQANIGIKQFNIQQQMRGNELDEQNTAAYEGQRLALQQGAYQNLSAIGETIFNYKQSKEYAEQMKNVYAFMYGSGQQQTQQKRN